jgi:hypothetical protein
MVTKELSKDNNYRDRVKLFIKILCLLKESIKKQIII